jgi:hypothetical protein
MRWNVANPKLKTEPYEVLLEASVAKPGYNCVELLSFPGYWGPPFKATHAERVDGIDYSAFKIYSVFIGQNRQNISATGEHPWQAIDLFDKWASPMDTAEPGLNITIAYRNESDKILPFAVKLVGKCFK